MMRLATIVTLFTTATAAAPLEQNMADECPTKGSAQLQSGVTRQPFIKISGGFSMGSEGAEIVSAPQNMKLEPPKRERPEPAREAREVEPGARVSGGFSVAAQSTAILTENSEGSFVETEGPLVSMGHGDGDAPEQAAPPPVHDDEKVAVDSLLDAYNGAMRKQEELVMEVVAEKEKQEHLRAEKERLLKKEEKQWAKLDAEKVLLETARQRVASMEKSVDRELDKIVQEEHRLARDDAEMAFRLSEKELQELAAVGQRVEKDHNTLLADRERLSKTEAKILKEEKHIDEVATKYRHHQEQAQTHPKQSHGPSKRAHSTPAVL